MTDLNIMLVLDSQADRYRHSEEAHSADLVITHSGEVLKCRTDWVKWGYFSETLTRAISTRYGLPVFDTQRQEYGWRTVE